MILDLLQAGFLGIVQGFTEFLPVSSSAHLKILPFLLGWETPGLVFDTSLHLGTSAALLVFFWKDFWSMIRCWLAPKTIASKEELKQSRTLSLGIVLGIIPVAVIGLLFESSIETFFAQENLGNTMWIIATALIVVGLLIVLGDRYIPARKKLTTFSLVDALVVGCFQVLALIPGVSRSGSTILGGLVRGLDREGAARFSFLLGTPVIILAGLFKLKDLAVITLTPELLAYFGVGVLFSALSGYLVITYFLAFLKKHGFEVFAGYRSILAFLLLILVYL